jgi:hypothetical protein
MNLTLPLQFGERPCDRQLILSLLALGLGKLEALGLMLMVWKDYALARDESRLVPADPAARAASPSVRIIEEYIGWKGEGGGFIAAAIESGFLVLVPHAREDARWMVLPDFFPANQPAATGVSQQKNAARERHAKAAEGDAMKQADEQMKLFIATKSPVIQGVAQGDAAAALTLIASIANTANVPMPGEGEWRNSLITTAFEAKLRHKPDELRNLYKWLADNRGSEMIPRRIDLILADLPRLIDLARRDYKQGSILDMLDEAGQEC